MTSPIPPTDDVQRELEQVRAAQPQQPTSPAPRRSLLKGGLRLLLLWALLILMFLGIWFFRELETVN